MPIVEAEVDPLTSNGRPYHEECRAYQR
jgi:hypothetical protein